MHIVHILTEDAPPTSVLVSIGDRKSSLILEGDLATLAIESVIKETPLDSYIALVRSIVSTARKQHDLGRITIDVEELLAQPFAEQESDAEAGRHFAENVHLAGYEFLLYKTRPHTSTDEFSIYLRNVNEEFMTGVVAGTVVGRSANKARDFGNTPPNDLTPEAFGEEVKALFVDVEHTNVKVFDVDALKELRMNLLLAVGQGAKASPRLIVVEYQGGALDEPYEVLVGKGVTFDTGGVNLKSSDGLVGMEKDMCGGASVVCALHAAALLGVKRNIVAIVPAAENAIGGNAYLTTSIQTSRQGTTVYIGNTDAEGRLVLADALDYAGQYYPAQRVMTVATLTGACIMAIGEHACGLFTENRELENALRNLGEYAGDYLWPLPPWPVYGDGLKHDFADMNNVQGTKKYGGASVGFRFLVPFATEHYKDYVHIDMAPRMDALASDDIGPGASGDPVRFLVRYLEMNP